MMLAVHHLMAPFQPQQPVIDSLGPSEREVKYRPRPYVRKPIANSRILWLYTAALRVAYTRALSAFSAKGATLILKTLSGVIPAHLLPFDESLAIDEICLRRHIRHLIDTDGVTGITTVAHASEVASLSDDEQRQLLDLVIDEVAGQVPVIAGVYDTDNARAMQRARRFEAAGADALLIFPPATWDMGHTQLPEMAAGYFSDIAEATALPMIVFVYPTFSGLHIPTDNLVRICADVPNVIAVKEWSNDIITYERNYRQLKQLDKRISVLSSFSKALLPSLVVGADGILSGHGSTVAALHVALFRAVQAGDLGEARAVSDRLYASTSRIYKDPFLNGHNRMKTTLNLLGEFDCALGRPPYVPISDEEREVLAVAAQETGIVMELESK
jgi:4-hydroxy-tetrahydrodipicolinate synthase